MYQLHKQIISGLKIYSIRDSSSDSTFSIVPTLGAALFRLKLSHKDTCLDLLQPWDTKNLEEYYYSTFSGSQLFPFPNRLAGGTYTIDNQLFKFPANDFGRPNALHGHLYNKAFRLSGWNSDRGTIEFEYNHNGDKAFPFSYSIKNTFQLFSDSLEINTQIINLSEKAFPYGYGWHPYFSTDLESDEVIDNHTLQLDTSTSFELDENMIPTTNEIPFDKFRGGERIGKIKLDTCFRRDPSDTIRFENSMRKYSIDIESKDFDYIQVYIPEDRKSIAIEPQTCAPDALNNGIGLRHLQSKGVVSFNLKIRLTSNF